MTATATRLSAHATIDLLDGLISYRQLDYWLRCGMLQIAEEATGSGSIRALTLIEVLRFRAMGFVIDSLGRGWSLRDIGYEVRHATDHQLASSLSLTNDRVQFVIDLRIAATEQALGDWVARERPDLLIKAQTAGVYS